MKSIVITGSTRGIGYGLATEFLKRDCSVVVSGRSQQAVNQAVTRLSSAHDSKHIAGHPCDVTSYEQTQSLWDAATARFGRVDVWINNAGISNRYIKFWELSEAEVRDVVNTNLLGAMFGSQIAMRGMLKQGSGWLYNMEGFGSDGRIGDGLALYGSTKSGLRYLTRSLLRDAKDSPVRIGFLSPGMVVTDLWQDLYQGQPERWEKTKKIVNILGDKVETVTPWLAERVLTNNKNGAHIAWLTNRKAFTRFLTASFNKRDLFAETQ